MALLRRSDPTALRAAWPHDIAYAQYSNAVLAVDWLCARFVHVTDKGGVSAHWCGCGEITSIFAVLLHSSLQSATFCHAVFSRDSQAYLPDPVALELDPDYPSPAVRQRLLHESSMQFRQITCVELLDGILERGKFNILCVPGGFAPHLDARLGVLGADIIRRFVSGGGGYVGICAGAFFGIMLELLPLEARDIDHCGSPSGPCRLLFSPIGQCVLGAESDEVTVRYHNGPLFRPLNSAVYSLATFRTDFRGRSFPMMDSPAAVCGMH
eukprot:3294143-Pleurochrysis_carterae.AAC.4